MSGFLSANEEKRQKMLKRKFDEIDTGGSSSSCGTSDNDESSNCSSEATDSSVDAPSIKGCLSARKKAKKSVKFSGITVYYFNRLQGFTCVPSEGGSTLGMGDKHAYISKFTLTDYAKEQKRLHKLILEEHRQLRRAQAMVTDCNPSSEEDSDEDDSAFEDFEDFYYLQPISVRQRRTMLRQSGVKKIDNMEKDHCKEIRLSREVCGCECRVFCDPESCACSLAGIKCQVDRLSFPCGCSKDGCGNLEGRVEFNPVRVRTHFIHTLMRLELEKKEDESPLHLTQQEIPDIELNKGSQDSHHDKTSIENDNMDEKHIDLSEFNSNELGSCRDCQNSDVCNAMMQEVQYATMEAEQQRMVINNMYNSQHNLQSCSNSNTTGPIHKVLLFNDNEEELYSAENTTSYYNFKQDESSYSETSDCSSEGSPPYDNADYQKTYQTLQSFGNSEENANQEFCSQSSSQTHNYLATSETVGQKYASLSTSNQLYKLEPISRMLSTVQNVTNNFNSVQPSTQSWRTASHYSTMPLYTRSLLTNTTSCNYTLMTNTTSEEIAANCPGIMNHMTHTDQSASDLPKYGNNMEGYDTEQGKTYTDLDKPILHESPAKVYTDLDAKPPLEKEAKTYTNLDTKSHNIRTNKCLSLDSDGKHFSADILKPSTNTFTDPLFTETSTEVKSSLQTCSAATYKNISEKYPSPVSCQNDSLKEVPCSKESHQTSGQNFGEIIKESLVETVSA